MEAQQLPAAVFPAKDGQTPVRRVRLVCCRVRELWVSCCKRWSHQYSFVCFGDKLADANPVFFCVHCYHPLHYSKDGELLYDDFKVLPYFHS